MRDLINLVETAGSPILMWHGSRGWDGSPEVRAPRKGRYEAGPGIYLTNLYRTARKYSKGGGATLLVEVKPDLCFADQVSIPLEDAVDFIRGVRRMRRKKEIIDDLRYNAERMGRDEVTANVIINLVVNHEAGAGEVGLEIAAFLASRGVDAALERQSGGEQWLVVVNPKAILSYRKVPAAAVEDSLRVLPAIR